MRVFSHTRTIARFCVSISLIVLSAHTLTACQQPGSSSVTGSPNSGGAQSFLGSLGGCQGFELTTSPPTSTTPFNIVANWNANRETSVNQTGGGYLVSLSHSYGSVCPETVDGTKTVANPGVGLTPTTATFTGLTLHAPWIYHIRVQAFSSIIGLSGSASTSGQSADYVVSAP